MTQRKIRVTFLSGNGVPNGNLPSHCHSGAPDHHVISNTPAADGWHYAVCPPHPPALAKREGWWCPDCVQTIKDLSREQGLPVISRTRMVPPAGRA